MGTINLVDVCECRKVDRAVMFVLTVSKEHSSIGTTFSIYPPKCFDEFHAKKIMQLPFPRMFAQKGQQSRFYQFIA